MMYANTATFDCLDYVLFGLSLSVSIAIGIYFGCQKRQTGKGYLYGDGKMNAVPIGLSLYSCAVSSVTIMGVPSEVYVFGSQFMLVSVGGLLSLLITWNLILPVFCGSLDFQSPYEYFERRFDWRVRTMSSVIYVVHTMLYMPVVLYASTLAVSEATGAPLALCTTIVGGVCVFYTVLGGFSSVIWTDTLQATLMLGSCVVVLCVGVSRVGSFGEVWRRAEQGGRIQFFNMDPNPLERITFWTTILGNIFSFAAHSGCSASTLQRFMSLPNVTQAKQSSLIGIIGYMIIVIITGLAGLCMYARYYDCDPVRNKEIRSTKQLMPYFIADTVGNISGFSGFLVAGLLSAGLSTVSAELNTVGGTIYHDVVKKIFKKKCIQDNDTLVMKLIVLANGLLLLGTTPLLEKAQHIIQLSGVIVGVTYGAKLGLMLLGTTFPKSNSVGAICGTMAGIFAVSWVSIGAIVFNVGYSSTLPVSTANCNHTNSVTEFIKNTTTVQSSVIPSESFFMYKLSFMYNTCFGTLVTLVVGLLVSYATGTTDISKLDPRLLIPYYRTRIVNAQSVTLQDMTTEKLEE